MGDPGKEPRVQLVWVSRAAKACDVARPVERSGLWGCAGTLRHRCPLGCVMVLHAAGHRVERPYHNTLPVFNISS